MPTICSQYAQDRFLLAPRRFAVERPANCLCSNGASHIRRLETRVLGAIKVNDPETTVLQPPQKNALPFLPLIAATPVIFALLTMSHLSDIWPLVHIVRHFSIPVMVIEMIIVILAGRRGVDVLAPLRAEKLWVKLALALVCVVAVGTMIAAVNDPLSAYVRTFAWVVHLLFGLSVAGITRKFWAGREQEVWLWLMVGLLAYLGTLIAFVWSLGGAMDFNWISFGLGVTHVRQLGFYSAAGFSVAIGLAVLTNEQRMRWLWTAVAAAMIAISFWSGTRSSVLSSFTALGVAALFCREMRTWRAAGLAVLTFVLGAALSVVYVAPEPGMGLKRIFTSVADQQGAEIASGRVEVWIGTTKSFTKRPFFGYGESQFRTTEPSGQGVINHPHNMEIQFLYQWGILGGGSFLALVVLLFWRLIGVASRNAQLALPSLILVANMLAMAQIEGSMYHPYPVMITVFALAFMLAGANRRDCPD